MATNKVIRIIFAIIVVLFAVLTWHLVEAFLPDVVRHPEEVKMHLHSIDRILDTLVVLMIAVVLSNFLTGLVNTNIGSFGWIPDRIAPLAEVVVKYGVWIVALSFIAPVWGTTMNYMLGAMGILGVGVAFAAQDTIQNVFEFGKLVVKAPFVEGDTITVLEITGVVQDISTLETVLLAEDGETVSVPNNVFATNPVTTHVAESDEEAGDG